MSNVVDKVALYYFGASGGFYALWHILLGTSYRCSFPTCQTKEQLQNSYNQIKGSDWPNDLWEATEQNVDTELYSRVKELQGFNILKQEDSIQEVYNYHWNITEKSKWKQSEVWPVNSYTENLDSPRIYYYCNPTIDDWEYHQDSYRIFLYTDIDTQLLLAKNKKCWYYHRMDMPPIDKIHKETFMLWDSKVYGKIKDYKNGDLYIKLQDCVRTQGAVLLNALGSEINQKNIEHNNMWINLHNKEEKAMLKVDTFY